MTVDGKASAATDEIDAHEDLLAQTWRLLNSLAAPELAPFLADWPRTQQRRAVVSRTLYVLRWLPEAARDAPSFGHALVKSLCRAAPSLAWGQTYTVSELGADFLENYGWSELIGEHGPIPSEQIACGWLLLGPGTLYPRHRHEAEEIYLPLAGRAAWQQGDGLWREKSPGTLIHHGRDEPHAMRAGDRPLLALYVWRSADLSQKAHLDPPTVG
jgi:hypothetical protein